MKKPLFTSLIATASVASLIADDSAAWPTWGGDPSRNMVSEEVGLPGEFQPGELGAGESVVMDSTYNVKWVAKLGSQSYGTPTVAGGMVYVGTNNEAPRDENHVGDRGIVMAFDEETGEFRWQMVAEKLGAGKVSDWEFLGMCSSPTVVGEVAYVITNRCEVVALDINGLSNGNQGMQEEAIYRAGKYDQWLEDPDSVDLSELPGDAEHDADILWVYNMREELGVFPHNIASSYVLYHDGKLYVTTSNGVDWSHTNIPAPQAPSLICLDAKTGEYLGEQDNIVSRRVLHCSWSSPALAEVEGEAQVIFAAGDGWVYGLGTEAELAEGEDPNDPYAIRILPELWRYDANPPEYRKDPETGEPVKYATFDGPSECIGTPVYYDGLIYATIGQDPEHGEGVGMISAIDPTKRGDISGQAVWTFQGIERSISTPSVHDGLVYIADYSGRVFCLDAKTGEQYWMFDTKGHIWGNTLVADGKVYIGNEEGELYVLKAGKELELLNTIEFPAQIFSSPVAANGVLYVPTMTHLYAFQEGIGKGGE
jgi:outer membrane protein assembly factor BamB